MARAVRLLRRALMKEIHGPEQKQHWMVPSFNFSVKSAASSPSSLFQFRRTYMSEMRKSAFEGNVLRLLRNEIQYELERSPPNQPVTKYNSFTFDDRPGEQWIRLKRKYVDEDIKVEATMFDGAVPAPKSAGSVGTEEDMLLHISVFVCITKGEGSDVLEFLCSAWPDSLEITKLYLRPSTKLPAKPYAPEFKELDDELQKSLYEFLDARGVNDDLAGFLHEYVENKDKIEFITWMENVKSFIEKK